MMLCKEKYGIVHIMLTMLAKNMKVDETNKIWVDFKDETK